MASQKPNRILLRGGTLLLHDENHVKPTVSDLLIENSKISKIDENIQLEAGDTGTKVIDCRDKIISPGFISTHHHLVQTAQKGHHANDTLVQYFPIRFTSCFYTLEDTFYGQLGGALEAIDAGTTTVVDHATVNLSPDHGKLSQHVTWHKPLIRTQRKRLFKHL